MLHLKLFPLVYEEKLRSIFPLILSSHCNIIRCEVYTFPTELCRTFIRSHMTIYKKVYFWTYSAPFIYLSPHVSKPLYLVNYSLPQVLQSSSEKSTNPFVFKIVLATLGSLDHPIILESSC